jgi:hypothetical protein
VNWNGKCEGPGGGDQRGALCIGFTLVLYIKAIVFVYMSVWAVPGRFFQSLPVPCGASPDVTDSREKRNKG